ncbi:cytochrome P450 [Luteibacter sp. 9135]|uniref:cytochrome P450 n=1 Tax=Luteibacter sp. 9135 TaxID=1500893 RepID=UPI000560A441|nr:cytochrome P450 [Luteibacter sp. 9135]
MTRLADVVNASDIVLHSFIEEVRRFYPFFPAAGGRVARPFTWRGMSFDRDEWLLLDLYGTNHDPRIHDDPGRFRADRFLRQPNTCMVAQGFGPLRQGHRCAGEGATVALLATLLRTWRHASRVTLPDPDAPIPTWRIPTLPRHGVLMRVEAD